jgi:hypothetical protein
MILEIHDHLQKPLVVNATRLLITTPDGTPLAFAVEYGEGHYRIFHAGDKDFVDQLRLHKFDKTVIVTHHNFKPNYPDDPALDLRSNGGIIR